MPLSCTALAPRQHAWRASARVLTQRAHLHRCRGRAQRRCGPGAATLLASGIWQWAAGPQQRPSPGHGRHGICAWQDLPWRPCQHHDEGPARVVLRAVVRCPLTLCMAADQPALNLLAASVMMTSECEQGRDVGHSAHGGPRLWICDLCRPTVRSSLLGGELTASCRL